MRFEDYVTERGPSLLRLAFVLTSGPHRAEDLTQTVLADAFCHRRRVSTTEHPNAYVRRMLVNAHLDWHRRRSSTERPSDLSGYDLAGVRDPEDLIASRDQLRDALATLAPRARTVLVLRYYVDLTDAEIAAWMGVSVSSVRATASRALGVLRRCGSILEDTP